MAITGDVIALSRDIKQYRLASVWGPPNESLLSAIGAMRDGCFSPLQENAAVDGVSAPFSDPGKKNQKKTPHTIKITFCHHPAKCLSSRSFTLNAVLFYFISFCDHHHPKPPKCVPVITNQARCGAGQYKERYRRALMLGSLH